jgi:O-antigen/teichoic acid export membrane protein
MAMSKVAQNLKSVSKLLSDESLTKKAYLNALASALDYASRLLVGFLITPMLVPGLGDFLYGVWRVLGRLVGYIEPASGRPTQALKWTLANQQASTDYEQRRRYVGSTVVIWALFLPLMVVLGGVLVWFAPYWLDAPVEFFWIVRWTAGILMANLAMTSLVAVPRSVLEGENLGYKRMGLSAVLVFVGGGFTALALYFNAGLVGVAAATLAAALLTGAIFLRIVRAYVPWFGIARPSLQAARQFLGLSWWFLGWNLVRKLMMSGDVVVLGMLDSVELVTAYSLTRYAPETLISLVAIVVFGIMPGLGGIIGSGNIEKAANVRSEIMSLTWMIVTVFGSTVLLWNWAFIRLWVGAEYYAGPIPTLLIVMVVLQFVLIRNDANIIDLTLRLRRKVFMGALSVAISLVIAGAMVGYFKMGITGVCLGFLAGRSALSVGYPVLVGRFLGVSLFSQLRGMLRPAFITLLLFGLALMLSEFLAASPWFATSGWIELAMSVGATFGVASLLAFYAGLSGNQRGHILRRVRMVMTTASD